MKNTEFLALSRAVVYFLTHFKGELSEDEKQEIYQLHSRAHHSTRKHKKRKQLANKAEAA